MAGSDFRDGTCSGPGRDERKEEGMKKGQIAEGIVERTDFPNKAVVRVCHVFAQTSQADPDLSALEQPVGPDPFLHVKNALPGQYVRCRITKKRSGRCEGQLLEVIRPAGDEQESDCPHAGICGGCLYRTLPYGKQLELKEGQVRRLLEEACEDPRFEGILASPVEEGYRNKMEFSFGDAYKGGPLSLGLHKRGSFYDIVATDGCRIVDEDYRAILRAVLELCREWDLPYYHRTTHHGYLRYLVIRKAAFTGQILTALITTRQFEPASRAGSERSEQQFEQEFLARLRALALTGTLTGVIHMYNDSVADVASSEESKLLYGQEYITEELLGLRFKITPFSFFQTNSAGAQVLYSKVREYIGDTQNKEIFDLYSGTGTIAQILAPVARSVTGVEIVGEAVAAAKENAAANGLSNCSFLEGDVLKVVDELDRKPDLIILDPPRDGIHPKALPKIIRFGVDRIVYVSCKITSLVRDLEMLQAAGYQVRRSCCVDMFPATANIETVVQLSKGEG